MKQILLTNVRVYDPIDGLIDADSVMVTGNRITGIGNREQLRQLTTHPYETIDLQGKIMLPAFIDTHTHFFANALKQFAVDLVPAKNMDEIAAILIRYRESWEKAPQWVRGSGWDRNIYPDTSHLDRYFLDRIFPDVPVCFESRDYHAKWCNSLALKLAGIDKFTADPPGGSIGHFADGTPNGLTSEKAWELIDRAIPRYSETERLEITRYAIRNAWENGLAEVHSMEELDKLDLYQSMVEEGIAFRFTWHLPQAHLDTMIERGVKSYTGTDKLKIGGMKIFMDGSLGSQTAYMYDPYPRSGTFGSMVMNQSDLFTLMERGIQNGITSSIHAIGDRCVHEVLTVIDALNRQYGWGKHRMEHVQCIRKEDIEILLKNNVYCAMQPIHLRGDIPLLPQHWSEEALKGTYSFGTLLRAGLEPGFGSDAPVEMLNPYQGIYAAMERKYGNDPQEPTWLPEERISQTEAIRGYTIWAAKASESQHQRGRIRTGYLADLLILDDFTDQESTYWLQSSTQMLLVDGEVVYVSPGLK